MTNKFFNEWVRPVLLSLAVSFLGWTALTFDSIRMSVVEIRQEMKSFIEQAAIDRKQLDGIANKVDDVDRRVTVLESTKKHK